MSDRAGPRYELYYWPGLQGRGEFVRLLFEEAGVPYVDVARLPASKGGGVQAIQRILSGEGAGLRPFAPPVLKVDDLLIAQVAGILQFVAPRLGLVPDDPRRQVEANQIQLTIADLVAEAHNTHHPISAGLYYEDQRAEARRYAEDFTSQRMPKFLGYFEEILGSQAEGGGEWLLGAELSYVDLSMFQVLSGLEYAFPNAFARLSPEIPLLLALRGRVAARPRIAAYLASKRRLPFNEHGIFRRYPELDE